MQSHSFLWHYLWIAPHLLQIPLVLVMFRRKLSRDFPWFVTYTSYQVLVNAAMFAASHSSRISGHTYHVAADIETLISIVLRFAVIYEVFRVLLRPYASLKRISSILGNSTLIIFLLGALVVAVYGPVPEYTTQLISMSLSADRAGSLVQIGLLLFLFLFSSYFAIPWQNFAFGVAIGFSLYLAVQLALSALLSQAYIGAANIIDMAAYHCSVLIWLGYALARQRGPAEVKRIPDHRLETWDLELQRLLQR